MNGPSDAKKPNWGCPDGKKASDYSGHEDWSHKQWRWEFLRRHEEIRLTYQLRSIDDFKKRYPGRDMPVEPAWLPEYADWSFGTSPALAARTGYSTLCNPLYSRPPDEIADDHSVLEARTLRPFHLRAVEWGNMKQFEVIGIEQVAIVFDPAKPLEPQLEGIKEYLLRLRHHTLPSEQKRRHRGKWLTYLRVLDAREAGASWAECADILPGSYSNANEQTARDVHTQAQNLQVRL